jgi:ankyrin repeat protein
MFFGLSLFFCCATLHPPLPLQAGSTALMHAFRNGHLAIAEMLVARGADVDAKTK